MCAVNRSLMQPPAWDRLSIAYARALKVLENPPGRAHLLGIGGVGMAGLAVLLRGRGHEVSGCDLGQSRVSDALQRRGIPVFVGHSPAHISGKEQVAIRSPAVSSEEPEWRAVLAAGIPSFDRGVMLAALARQREALGIAGTHGKTTTTAMLVHILRTAGRSLSFAVGGEVDDQGTVAESAPTGPLVFEADESDGTLALYECRHAVITNVELDHVDFFRSAEALDACFGMFAERTRGEVWYCADDPGAVRAATRALCPRGYGFSAGAELRAIEVFQRGRASQARIYWRDKFVGEMILPIPGATNVLNALGAIGAASSLGVDVQESVRALATYRPVRRRFEIFLENQRAIVVSDYAHHPTEIRALLAQAAAFAPRRLVGVFQPHRFTRTALLGPEFPPSFDGLDRLVLAPVYAASEPPMPGGSHLDLAAHFERQGRSVEIAHSLLDAWERIRDNWRAGDVLLVIGAGDVEKIAAWAADEWQA